MLLRNIDKAMGLCSGTRILVSNLGKHIIDAHIISENNVDKDSFL